MARTSADPSGTASIWGTNSVTGDRFGKGLKWELKNFVGAIKEMCPKLDWALVFRSLDVPDFYCGDSRSLEVYVSAFYFAFNTNRFNLGLFYSVWSNLKGQVSFLKCATQSPRELIDIPALSMNHILTPENISTAPPSTKAVAANWLLQQMNSVDLLKIIVILASEEIDDDAKLLLDLVSRQSPELVLLGLCQIQPPVSQLHRDVAFKLTTMFLAGHSSSTFVLTRVWAMNPGLVLDAMVSHYKQDPNMLSRILDISQELKALPLILDEKRFPFVIDLATLASRREYVNLEKWLTDNVSLGGDMFLRSTLEFVQMKLLQLAHADAASQSIPFSEDRIAIFFKLFQSHASRMSAMTMSLWSEVQRLASQVVPKVAILSADSSTAADQKFSPDVEEEVNNFYQLIYKGTISISEIIENLQRLKMSQNKKDQDIFSCMIHNLFDEYRFFHKYPEKELLVTGELFGTLIRHQLIAPAHLALGLRYVLDSLKKPLGSKMFRFGVAALIQFQPRLAEWPQYCNHLLQISHLVEAHPDVAIVIRSSLKAGGKTMSDPNANEDDAPEQSSFESASNSLSKASTVLELPSEAVRDQILFIINNLSTSNLDIKLEELKGIVKESYFGWLCNYLVMSRLSIEANYHWMYLNMIDTFEHKTLDKIMLKETYANIKVLLASDKALVSAQERTLIKNLGAWLGAITLARDRPIKQRDLPIKQLLIDGYEKGRLIVNIPFVCKVLEQSKGSKVFRPPNPWLMAILRELVDLYHFADLKLNLKFEIEVMCRNIDVDIKEIENLKPSSKARYLANGDSNIHEQHMKPLAIEDPSKLHPAQMIPSPSAAPSIMFDENGNMNIPNLASFVSFGSNSSLFANHPMLKQAVLIAIDRSIHEILAPVVERSVSIAVVATREVILKDFAADPSEERMRSAAIAMAQNLSGNLALVTCKEPFRISMTGHLRIQFQQRGLNESMTESLITSTVADNVELGCSIIEKAAIEKAVPEINNDLAQHFFARRRNRERGMPWVETPSQYPSSGRFPVMLPEALRIRPGAPQQLKVYEDFFRNTAMRMANVPPQTLPLPLESEQAKVMVNPLQQVMEQLHLMLDDLDKSVRANPDLVLSSLHLNHEIIGLLRQINMTISQFATRDEICIWFAQRVVGFLFQAQTSFAIEVYILLLERLCEISKRAARELSVWLTFVDDERKYNVGICVALIQSGLLNIFELDAHLSKEMESIRLPLIEFAISLIKKSISESLVTPNDFYFSILTLAKLSVTDHLPERLKEKVAQIQQDAPGIFILQDHEYLVQKESFVMLFDEWVRLTQSSSPEQAWSVFHPHLVEKSIEDPNAFALFIRHSTEVSIDTYYKLRNAPGGAILGYEVIDSLSNLIFLLIKHLEKDDEGRIQLFSRTLSVLSLVTIHMHEIRRELFDQRPFYRIFSGILVDLENEMSTTFSKIQFELVTAFGNTLLTLRPTILPGFIFSWVELLSHRLFLPKLLSGPNKIGWSLYHELLIDVFTFLWPFLKHADMSDPIRVLYKGLLRLLLLLLHDFPEFLCDLHFSLCDVIPPTCVQLRNLILSAFPRNMRLPDPFTPNLKVDFLPEINESPTLYSEYTRVLRSSDLITGLDHYLKSRGPPSFLAELPRKLLASADSTDSGSSYNVPLINSLVLYIGVHAIQQMQNKTPNDSSSITQSIPMEIFQRLVATLDSEGRYHVLNAISNQLRYPNSHTHYFSCVLLFMFAESGDEGIKQQITRVLLERLIVNRPHPWGLLITFIELLKNPRYNFWSHSFTRCAPEIERLFESVARSCMIPTTS